MGKYKEGNVRGRGQERRPALRSDGFLLFTRCAEFIFDCKMRIDASTTPRLTGHGNYGKDRAIHQDKKFIHIILSYFGHVQNHFSLN